MITMKHQVEKIDLKNGAELLLVDIKDAKYVIASLIFNAGYRYVDSEKYEIPHVLEHLSTTPEGWNEFEYSAAVMRNGAYRNAFTNSEEVEYFIRAPKFDWERVLDLHLESILKPKLQPKIFEKEMNVVENELENYLNDNRRLIFPAWQQATGVPLLTYEQRLANLKNIKLQDLKDFYKQSHTTNNLKIFVGGDLRGIKTEMIKKFSKIALPKGKRLDLKFEREQSAPVLIKKKDIKNIDFRYSMIIDRKLTDQDFYNLDAVIYTFFSWADSLIYSKAREKGIVYSIQADYFLSENSTEFFIVGTVTKKHSKELFKLIRREFNKVLKNGFTKEQINKARQFELGQFSMSDVTPAGIFNHYKGYLKDFNKIGNYDRRQQKIKNVSLKRANELFREFAQADNQFLIALANCEQQEIDELYEIIKP